ncbi:MAG: YqgE/AlgH family protein [Flavobacteriales bacterium]|nr:YqgE/AlgH family protein [Flavobacteriales bacterium]MCB9197375.1 YqgE/AlgH family protein [Flavobacteriales bacterium]
MNELFDIAKLNQTAPAKGKFLISEPFMSDDFFKRSVVFLCEHNAEGSFGFVMNNILSVGIGELLDDLSNCDFEVGFGGPVNSSNLYYLHTIGEKLDQSYEVIDGIFTGGDFDQLKTLINTGLVKTEEIKFFLGYSGWSAGQLDKEIEENSWIVADFDSMKVFKNTDKSLWKNLLDEMGGKFKMIANFPEDPSLN